MADDWTEDGGDSSLIGRELQESELQEQELQEERDLRVRAPRVQHRRIWVPLARGVVVTVVLVAASVSAILLLGAFVPGIPVLGVLGSFVAGSAPRIAVGMLLLVAISLALLLRAPSWPRRTAVALTVLALVGASVITARWISLGSEYGVRVDPFSAALADSAPDLSVVYDQHDGGDLSIHVWQPRDTAADAPAGADTGSAPVAVVVHGGGWIGGSPTNNSGTHRWYANQGWLVLSVEYPLSGARTHLWDEAGAHVGCALVWAGAHAGDLGGDPERLVLMGDSAGGNLAMIAGYRAAAGTLEPSCAGDIPQVRGIAVLYPAVDPAGTFVDADLLLGPTARRMVTSYTGGDPSEFPERYRDITPATHLSTQAPPTLIIHGSNDHLVPAQSSRTFVDQARSAALTVDLIEVPFGEHVFDTSPMGSALARGLTQAWWVDRGIAPDP